MRSPESAYNDRHPEPQDVFWSVEIAQTSLRKDLELKSAGRSAQIFTKIIDFSEQLCYITLDAGV